MFPLVPPNKMTKKEIEFYLKFHKGFRKRHKLENSQCSIIKETENLI